IFPSMLKAHGEYILPDNVPANEFLNIEGDKISTSRNWAVWLNEYLEDFPDQQDAMRYVLTSSLPETKDHDFTWKDIQEKVNNELVAVFGNFVNRSFVLMHKLCGRKVPPFHNELIDDYDKNIVREIADTKKQVEESLENYHFRDALFAVIDLSRKGNKYLQDKEPWIKATALQKKADALTEAEKQELQQQIDNCMHICLQLTANLAILINPFLPHTARKMLHMMKVVERMLDWENAGSLKLLSVGYSLRAPELLFRKIEDEEIAKQVEKLKTNAQKGNSAVQADQEPAKVELKPEIVYDDFARLDLRTGKILSAEKVKKADRLLKLEVDLGFETRTIVSGIAEHFTPESIVGKQVVVVAN